MYRDSDSYGPGHLYFSINIKKYLKFKTYKIYG